MSAVRRESSEAPRKVGKHGDNAWKALAPFLLKPEEKAPWAWVGLCFLSSQAAG